MLDMDVVYQRHAEMVFRFLMTLCRDEDTAEELTQETFYQATWLCQIAKHLWFRELDRRRKKTSLPLQEEMVSQNSALEERVCIQEEKMEVFRRVHILDETSKEVLLLRITGSFSFREIGEIFGKNENWARVTFYRAKQKIAKGEKKNEM